MRPSRMLRERAKRRQEPAVEPTRPEGYRHSQTDGWASTERAGDRRFEHGRNNPWHDMPVIFGFQPNPASTHTRPEEES